MMRGDQRETPDEPEGEGDQRVMSKRGGKSKSGHVTLPARGVTR